jgi:hypothetical protein
VGEIAILQNKEWGQTSLQKNGTGSALFHFFENISSFIVILKKN